MDDSFKDRYDFMVQMTLGKDELCILSPFQKSYRHIILTVSYQDLVESDLLQEKDKAFLITKRTSPFWEPGLQEFFSVKGRTFFDFLRKGKANEQTSYCEKSQPKEDS